MRYCHVTLDWSLEGQNPKKLITEAEKEGFVPLYSKIASNICQFFNKDDVFDRYNKIQAKFSRNSKFSESPENIYFHNYRGEPSLPSFGDLFRNKAFPELIFSLVDDSGDFERYSPKALSEKNDSTWFACWATGEKCLTDKKEALVAFINTILRISGCDKSADSMQSSDTCSKSHQETIDNLKDYNLKQAAFKENRHLFELISQTKIKDILIEFSKKSNILLSDFAKGMSEEKRDEAERNLNFMSGQGLLEKSLIVICKQKNVWWNMTIPSLTMLKELEKAAVTCTSCGAKITDEKVDTLFKISEKGTKLVAGSYWMVGKVVDILRRLDFRDEDIFSSVNYGGDELDIVALTMGRIFVFELKDREFNLGDAYKFHSKVSRLKEKSANTRLYPIVFTTKSIADEARKLLQEVFDSNNRNSVKYVMVEGLENVESEIKKLQDTAINSYIDTRVRDVISRFPARTIFDQGIFSFNQEMVQYPTQDS